MVIVSQNKRLTTKSMELSIEDTKKIMVESNCGKLYFLGEYKTEKRAKEVLQEIIKAYRDYRTAECDGYTNVLQETAVFEMPKE